MFQNHGRATWSLLQLTLSPCFPQPLLTCSCDRGPQATAFLSLRCHHLSRCSPGTLGSCPPDRLCSWLVTKGDEWTRQERKGKGSWRVGDGDSAESLKRRKRRHRVNTDNSPEMRTRHSQGRVQLTGLVFTARLKPHAHSSPR